MRTARRLSMPAVFAAALSVVLVVAACGGGDEATPTPAPPTAAPTPSPTTTPLPPISRDDLRGMVLTQSDVAAEFPMLVFNAGQSGFDDNEDAAIDTIDPDDSGPDLEARGRIDGYDSVFADSAAFLEKTGNPFTLDTVVGLFDSSESARAFLQREFADFSRFQGREIDTDGTILKEFRPSDVPAVGSDSAGGVVTLSVPELATDFFAPIFEWRRGRIVATIRMIDLEEQDRSGAIGRLAQEMDARIAAVLAGKQ